MGSRKGRNRRPAVPSSPPPAGEPAVLPLTVDDGASPDPTTDATAPAASRRRRWVFRLIALAVPLLLPVLIEIALRILGVGRDLSFLVRAADGKSLTANPEFGRLFFPDALVRTPARQIIADPKPDDLRRVLVLGESAAMGTPEPNHGPGRRLETMLRLAGIGGSRWEIVNGAMTAIDSHAVLRIAREAAPRLRPDVVVVCMGNNEVVGPRGPGTVFDGPAGSLTAIRAGCWFRSLRLGQVLSSWFAGPPRADAPTSWRGLEMFADRKVPADDPRLATVRERFEANLRDILAAARGAGARVVLCTVAVNLAECPPFDGSPHRDWTPDQVRAWQEAMSASDAAEAQGDHAGALRAFEDFRARGAPESALALYRRGKAMLNLGRNAEARDLLARSRDADALRFRADSSINDIIRRVAAEEAGPDLVLADAERRFDVESVADGGIAGGRLFTEHVHFTPAGTHLIADEWFRAVTSWSWGAPDMGGAADPARDAVGRTSRPPPPTEAACDAAEPLTVADRVRLAEAMLAMTARPPFRMQWGHEARQARAAAGMAALRTDDWNARLQESADLYRRALRDAPDDWRLHEGLAGVLFEQGEAAAAADHYARVGAVFPDDRETRLNRGAALLRAGRADDAAAEFRTVLAVMPSHAPARKGLGDCLMRAGQRRDAEAAYREAIRLDPGYAEAMVNLAAVHRLDGNATAAEETLRSALQIRPIATAHEGLALLYASQKRDEDALREARAALQADPRMAPSRDLATSLMLRAGDLAGATAMLEGTVRLFPDRGEAHLRLARLLDGARRRHDAVRHYRRAAELGAADREALCRLALLLAASPDDRLRNGPEALRWAEAAGKARGGDDAVAADVLGMALAETGRWDDAVREALRAIELAGKAGRPALIDDIRLRIVGYRNARPARIP